jgi:polyisoprenoid-binding protein YceI
MALEKWTIDPAHSSIDFLVRHMLVSKVRGRFTKWSAALELDEQDISKSRVDVTIEAASVETHEAQRDTHLRSADFFDVSNHPTLTFKSKRVEAVGADKLRVTGDLTIRGTTREAVLDVERGGIVAKDPWGKRRAGFAATTTVHRKDFGVSYNAVLDQGGLALGEDVSVAIELEATTSAAATASTAAASEARAS